MKWFLGFCVAILLLLLVAGGGVLTWWLLQPETVVVEARFQVVENPPVIFSRDEDPNADIDFDKYRATQVTRISGFGVIKAALTNPALSGTFLTRVDEPSEWIEENLEVAFEGDSELMLVSLRGPKQDAEDLRLIVSAVCQAYLDEVVNKERLDRAKIGDALKASNRKLREEIRQKWEEYRIISEDIGVTVGEQDPMLEVLIQEIHAKKNEKRHLEKKWAHLQLAEENLIARYDNEDLKLQEIEEALAADPSVKAIEQELLELQLELRAVESTLPQPESKSTSVTDDPDSEDIDSEEVEPESEDKSAKDIQRIQDLIRRKKLQIEQQKNQLREQVEQKVAKQRKIEKELRTQEYQRKMKLYAARIHYLKVGYDIEAQDGEVTREKGIDELIQEVENRTVGSTELRIRKADIEQLEQVARELGRRLEAWDIESQADSRIKLIEPAHIAGD